MAHPVTERDPVCGMLVEPGTAAARVEHGGRTWLFCSARCAERFRAEPARWTGPAPSPAAAPEPGGTWVCPMHPEVVGAGPGACPLCGMALEPRTPGLDDAPDPELIDMRRRLGASLALSVPLLALAMGDMLPGMPVHHTLGAALPWLELALATPVVLWAGWPFFVRGWASVAHGSPNMFTLIALGTGTAYAYSLVATVAPGIFPDAFRGHGISVITRSMDCSQTWRTPSIPVDASQTW